MWKYERKLLPFGRLLRQKMRLALFGSDKAPERAQEAREMLAESERLVVGHREFMRKKGLRRVKSGQRAAAVVRLSRERKGNEAV